MLQARALVFPSICYESFAVTVVEALAAGLPVLCSKHGGSAELVARIGPEWLAPPGDAAAWAEALHRLDDDVVIDQASGQARAAYESQYTPRDSISTLLAIYASVQRDRTVQGSEGRPEVSAGG
jgi:glycosyltransferase involved in cell wall biosynthesis